MKVLLTGSTGFIGSHLVNALVASGEYEVNVLQRMNSKLKITEDVEFHIRFHTLKEDGSNLSKILGEVSPDCVVHLASLFLSSHTTEQIPDLIQSNLLYPTQLLDAMNENGIKTFINTGTSWEHYEGCEGYDPVNLYAATKKAFEDILQFYINAHQFKAVTIKLFDTYGPGDTRPKLFSLFKKVVKDGKPIEFSEGEQYLNLLYIDDVISAYCLSIPYIVKKSSFENEVFFIGSSEAIRLKDIASAYEDISGRKLNIQWGKRPYRKREVMKVSTDISAAEEKLGWKPQIDLREGISRLLKDENLK